MSARPSPWEGMLQCTARRFEEGHQGEPSRRQQQRGWVGSKLAAGVVLEPCRDRTAYAALVTTHTTTLQKTTIAKHARRRGGRLDQAAAVHMQVKLLDVLVRSIRVNEHECRRDFVLLLGTTVPMRASDNTTLVRLGVLVRRVAVRQPSRPVAPGLLLLLGLALVLPPHKRCLGPPQALHEGVPAIDKLHAWMLTEYRRVLVVDTDAMVLRPLDALFRVESHEPNTVTVMANHPYDLKQAACARPVSQRAIGALFVLTPSETVYRALLRDMMARLTTHWALANHAEQTGLACFFSNAQTLRVLPCAWFWDVSIPQAIGKRWLKDCITHSGEQRETCRTVQAHTESTCTWSAVRSRVAAVHFKGKAKPWAHAAISCLALRSGRLLHAGDSNSSNTAASATDELKWHNGRCSNVGRPGGLRVHWATGKPVPKSCCNTETLLQAEWYYLHRSGKAQTPRRVGVRMGTACISPRSVRER